MSSLRNILNPEDGRRRTVKLILNVGHDVSSKVPSSPTSPTSDLSASIAGEPSEDLSSKEHEPHPNCPDSLSCLPDTNGRPQHTLPIILRCAILGSPRKRLTIRDIYAAMEAKYLYYRTTGPTWKQSVRHHLSLNRLFERQPRPVTEPGFGSYWTVNLTAPPGTKRPRKRGRPNKDVSNGSACPPKKRGRPRKILQADLEEPQGFLPLDEDDENKSESPVVTDASNVSLVAEKHIQLEEDFEGSKSGEDDDPDVAYDSEDEYESEEEMIPMHPMDRRASLVGLSSFGYSGSSQSFAVPSFSSSREGSDNIIDYLQAEIANLRRQSAEAVSLSLRLSEQLAHAQAESSRTRAILRTIEGTLEDESKRRREAEKITNDEEKKRRKAEQALSDVLSRL